MTGRVRELPSATVERIAAGEVVTRPARAVAELLDNAVDADADRIEIAVEGDGRTLTVRDDGRGLSPADARRAVRPHTTSKLDPDGDLSAVDSLGFRGEALASIADAAGELELLTNDGDDSEQGNDGEESDDRQEGEEGAVRVTVTGTAGDLTTQTTPASRARGTTVTVRDLFADRPARRESLNDARREFGRISRLVARYALLTPATAFRLTHDGRETLATAGTGLRDALLAVYDRETARAATAVEYETTLPTGGDGGTALTVDGLVCDPSVTRSDRRAVHVGVRGRPVDDERLRRAVVDGYGRLLAAGDAPVAVVRLSLPAAAVDPNVHPAKRRVGLRAGEAVREAVRTAVSEALSTADLTRAAETATDVETALAPETGDSVLADATYVGQFDDLYLLCEADSDLLVVDQHAAHERVNFERLRAAVGDEVPSRSVSPPATLSVDPTVASAVTRHGDRLSALGFDAASLGGGTVVVRAVPAPLGRAAAPASLRETAAALARGESPTPRADLLADLACHPSLKAGDELDDAAARDLLARLAECDSPFACPHGRPTVLSVASSTLAQGFDRDGRR